MDCCLVTQRNEEPAHDDTVSPETIGLAERSQSPQTVCGATTGGGSLGTQGGPQETGEKAGGGWG